MARAARSLTFVTPEFYYKISFADQKNAWSHPALAKDEARRSRPLGRLPDKRAISCSSILGRLRMRPALRSEWPKKAAAAVGSACIPVRVWIVAQPVVMAPVEVVAHRPIAAAMNIDRTSAHGNARGVAQADSEGVARDEGDRKNAEGGDDKLFHVSVPISAFNSCLMS